MKKMLAIDGAFEGIRLLTGAVSAVYLQSRGLQLSHIAELKLIQAACGFFFELPAGLAADAYGHKKCLLISCIAGALAYFTYWVGDSFTVFAIAEILLSLCLALWSGTFEAFAIENGGIEGPALTTRFFHLNAATNAATTVLSGLIGSWIFSQQTELPFAVSAAGFLAASCLIGLSPVDQKMHEARHGVDATGVLEKLFCQTKATLAWLANHAEVRPTLIALGAIQFIIQPVIYYWQIWFSAKAGYTGVDLGIIFSSFQVTLVGAGIIAAWISGKRWTHGWIFQAVTWLIFSAALGIMFLAHDKFAQIAFFCLAEACFSLSLSALKARLARETTSSNRASAFSASALVGRATGMASLFLVAFAMSPRFAGTVDIVFLGVASGALILCVLATLLHYREATYAYTAIK